MIAIAISDNRATLGKIPSGDVAAWRIFNGSFKNVAVSPEELSQLIQMGNAYTTQHNRYRSADNFLAGQHLALDFDTRDENSSLVTLANNPFIKRFASFIHTTPSHTDEHPKSRVVFCLDRKINDVNKYAELAQSLVWKFEMADKSCKDPARFFYGANGCQTVWLGNILTLADAAELLVLPHREYLKKLAVKLDDRAPIVAPNEVSSSLLHHHSTSMMDRVRTAPDGEKYRTLRNAAVTMGGYIAGGYYQEDAVRHWLQAAIAANPNNVRDIEAANKTIDKGLSYGATMPLFFEMHNRVTRPQGDIPELAGISPSLTAEQEQQIIAVIRNREWKAYHDGMSAAQRDVWLQMGIPEYAVDVLNLGVRRRINTDTGEIDDALTVPYVVNNIVENVEFRGREVSYASPQPKLFLPEQPTKDSPVLVFSNSLKAIKAWLSFGHAFNVAGLPQATLSDINTDRPTVLVLEPGFNPLDYGLKNLRGTATSITLPFPVEKMIELGMDVPTLDSFVRSRRVFA